MMSSVLRSQLMLAEDVELVAFAELSDELRRQLGEAEGEFAISRTFSRSSTRLINAASAELVEAFRTASTIVQAVVGYSRRHDVDAEATLDAALPLLQDLISAGILVAESSVDGAAVVATYEVGQPLGDYRTMRCVQVLEDSELYQAGSADGSIVAIKIARSGHVEAVKARFALETAGLRRLNGVHSPTLLYHGVADGLPMFAMSWQSGIDAMAAAIEARASGDQSRLLKLLHAIARSYAEVHGRGVLHGDVHARNLLVGRDGSITLVDFGLATIGDEEYEQPLRGGVGFFYDPELALAMLDEGANPTCTPQGEQYSVAALLYLLATDHHYLDFNLVSSEMLSQITTQPPMSFHAAGGEPWPELETVLARALAKEPHRRFADMAAFAAALSEIEATTTSGQAASHTGSTLVETMLSELSLEGSLFADGLPGPASPVNFGAAGVAYALYRFACGREDGELLATADAWACKAARDQRRSDAFSSHELGITDDMSGPMSIFHRSPGVAMTRALIAQVMGDDYEFAVAAEQFVAASTKGEGERDLTLGALGTVLGASLLLDSQIDESSPLVDSVHILGEQRLISMWQGVAPLPRLDQCVDWPNLGIAHGWGGLLYTTLRWHEITGAELPTDFADRLTQLAECTSPTGRGLTVPWREDLEGNATMPGWCNGTAGLVHLACLAFETLGEESMLALAEAAAWNAWEDGTAPLVDLCCGLAGRAYALLALYRVTRDSAWLERAQSLAVKAVRLTPDQRSDTHPRHSLYKGELGLTLLIDELERPDRASMPVFERER